MIYFDADGPTPYLRKDIIERQTPTASSLAAVETAIRFLASNNGYVPPANLYPGNAASWVPSQPY